MVSLSNLFCFGSQVFLLVDTTAPLPHSQSKSGKTSETYENVVQPLSTGNETKLLVPEEDSFGPVRFLMYLSIFLIVFKFKAVIGKL